MTNSNLITGFALLIGLLTFTSCQKEIINPTEVTSNKKLAATELTEQNADLKSDPTFVLADEIEVDITISNCPSGTGFSVTAASDDADLTDGEYTINWYKNTEQTVLFEGLTLECVCQMGVRVEIYDSNGDLVGEDSLDLGAC